MHLWPFKTTLLAIILSTKYRSLPISCLYTLLLTGDYIIFTVMSVTSISIESPLYVNILSLFKYNYRNNTAIQTTMFTKISLKIIPIRRLDTFSGLKIVLICDLKYFYIFKVQKTIPKVTFFCKSRYFSFSF